MGIVFQKFKKAMNHWAVDGGFNVRYHRSHCERNIVQFRNAVFGSAGVESFYSILTPVCIVLTSGHECTQFAFSKLRNFGEDVRKYKNYG